MPPELHCLDKGFLLHLRLLVHGAVKQEIGSQRFIALAEQERLDAAVAVEAERLEPLDGGLLLLCQVHRHCARRQVCPQQGPKQQVNMLLRTRLIADQQIITCRKHAQDGNCQWPETSSTPR